MAKNREAWADWSDEALIEQAAAACQRLDLMDDEFVRGAISMNALAPLRLKITRLQSENELLRGSLEAVCAPAREARRLDAESALLDPARIVARAQVQMMAQDAAIQLLDNLDGPIEPTTSDS